MELVPPAGTKGSRSEAGTNQKRVQHRIGTARAGKYQVLVERGFQYARIRGTEDSIGLLNVVRDTQPWFGFVVRSQAVVEIAAQTQIKRPIAFGNRVLDEHGQQLDIGVAAERKQRSTGARQVKRCQRCARRAGKGIALVIQTV